MATLKFIALEHHKKSDGNINIKLYLYHKGQRAYWSTSYTASPSMLKKDYSFKDKDLILKTTADLVTYMKRLNDLGSKADKMTVKQVLQYITTEDKKAIEIDFISFAREHITGLRAQGKKSSAGTLQAVINNFTDFMKSEYVVTNDITSKLLRRFENYLRLPYKQTRLNQFGNKVTIQQPGMDDAGIFANMKNFRILFNAARAKYNDEESGIIQIPNYPFKTYKLKEPGDPEPRPILISYVKMVKAVQLAEDSRAELGRDMFMLSFYMLGMNAKDIYVAKPTRSPRLAYNRSKTKDKRSDGALISVKIVPEARVLMDKYFGKLQSRFSTVEIFRKAIAVGLGQVATQLEVDRFDFYSARHTVATEARNTLKYQVGDVGEALNHINDTNKVTDKYIKKDWTLIDNIQSGVISLLYQDGPES